jgi:hypothetical protein
VGITNSLILQTLSGYSTIVNSEHTSQGFVGNVGPKNDHEERSDLAKRFFIAGWERERAKRVKREKQEGQGLKYPSMGLSMI